MFMKNPIYIYGLVDPRTDKIRYVGKSNNPERRLYAHIKDVAVNREELMKALSICDCIRTSLW
jgi:hypothetical protein